VKVFQFLKPEFFDCPVTEPDSNHRVVWVRLPATAVIFKVLHLSDSPFIPRVEGFVRSFANADSLTNLNRSSANVTVNKLSRHRSSRKSPNTTSSEFT
jgi:hypothetical protein